MKHILDIGCGLGHFAHRLLKDPEVTITAIEPDPYARKRLQKTFSPLRMQVFQTTIEQFEVRKNICDAATCIFAWDHIAPENIELAKRQVASALKPHGFFYLLLEILPPHDSKGKGKRLAYERYHQTVILDAQQKGHDVLAQMETEAMMEGIAGRENKPTLKEFTEFMGSHFSLEWAIRLFPQSSAPETTGGVYAVKLKKI